MPMAVIAAISEYKTVRSKYFESVLVKTIVKNHCHKQLQDLIRSLGRKDVY